MFSLSSNIVFTFLRSLGGLVSTLGELLVLQALVMQEAAEDHIYRCPHTLRYGKALIIFVRGNVIILEFIVIFFSISCLLRDLILGNEGPL